LSFSAAFIIVSGFGWVFAAVPLVVSKNAATCDTAGVMEAAVFAADITGDTEAFFDAGAAFVEAGVGFFAGGTFFDNAASFLLAFFASSSLKALSTKEEEGREVHMNDNSFVLRVDEAGWGWVANIKIWASSYSIPNRG
jgi:hypothetical protein